MMVQQCDICETFWIPEMVDMDFENQTEFEIYSRRHVGKTVWGRKLNICPGCYKKFVEFLEEQK